MKAHKRLSRRSVLFGTGGALVALPLLEAMFDRDRALYAANAHPARFAFVFYPNGAVEYEMSPTSLDELTGVLEPFAPFRDRLISVNGLNNRDNNTWEIHGVDLGSGSPHEFNAPTFLTCQKLGSLDELRLSPSIDQLIGAELQGRQGHRLRSLVIGDGEGRSDIGQGGVNRAYHHLISWQSETQYVVPLSSTAAVFAEIYGGQPGEAEATEALLALQAQKRSILDSTAEQLAAMQPRVSQDDRTRLELYLDAVRSVETRLDSVPTTSNCPTADEPALLDPESSDEFPAYLDTMTELVVLALQCQVTPVATFQLSRGNDGVRSGVAGVSGDQHGVSHYNSGGSQDELRLINTFYNDRAAQLFRRLAETAELDRSLLDSTLVLYGSGIADADAHDGSNCGIWLAGGEALGMVPGRVIDHGLGRKDYGEGTPLANLHLGLAGVAGVDLDSFGNSTGRIELVG